MMIDLDRTALRPIGDDRDPAQMLHYFPPREPSSLGEGVEGKPVSKLGGALIGVSAAGNGENAVAILQCELASEAARMLILQIVPIFKLGEEEQFLVFAIQGIPSVFGYVQRRGFLGAKALAMLFVTTTPIPSKRIACGIS